MNTKTDYKQLTSKIAASFEKAAENYHQKADIQRRAASSMMDSFRPWKQALPPGPVLEVGCGTGILSELLIKEIPWKEIIISDVSPKMVEICRSNLEKAGLLSDKISFKVLDANDFEVVPDTYAMVVSNFAAHWFKDTSISLERLGDCIVYGGLLLSSFPGNKSFANWRETALELGLPFTANPLPDSEEVVVKVSMSKVQVDFFEGFMEQEFDSSLDFFRHLKEIGSSVSKTGHSLSPKQFRLLTNYWDNKAGGKKSIKWHIVYVAAKKE